MKNAVLRPSLGYTTHIPNMSDGLIHTARIAYTPGTLKVFLDDLVTPAVVVPVALHTYLNLDGGCGWVGLTACVGSSLECHDILMWSFAGTQQRPRIEQVRSLPGGMLLEFTTFPGFKYGIRYSDDLETWLKAEAEITATGSMSQWLDLLPAGKLSSRFYRIQSLP